MITIHTHKKITTHLGLPPCRGASSQLCALLRLPRLLGGRPQAALLKQEAQQRHPPQLQCRPLCQPRSVERTRRATPRRAASLRPSSCHQTALPSAAATESSGASPAQVAQRRKLAAGVTP